MTIEPLKLGATVIVVSKDLKVLIVQRSKGKVFEGMWTVPGGKMESTDGVYTNKGFCYFPLEHSAVRELLEETGIKINKRQLRFLCSILVERELHMLILSFYTYINKKADEIPIKLTESQEYKWVDKYTIPIYDFIPDIGSEILDVITRIEKEIKC